MGLLFGKVNIDDRDLEVIEAIVGRVCTSIDGMTGAIKDVASAANRVADVIEKKQVVVK